LKVSSPHLAISISSFFDIFSIIKIRNRRSECSVPVLRVDFLSFQKNLLQFKFFWKDKRYKEDKNTTLRIVESQKKKCKKYLDKGTGYF